MDLVGQSRSSWAGVPVRFVRPHRLRDHHGGTRTHASKSTVHERGRSTTITTVCRMLQPRPHRLQSAPATTHDPPERTLVSPTLVQTTTLLLRREELLLPTTRLLIGRWVVRRLVAASRLAGARVVLALCSLAGGNALCSSSEWSFDPRRRRLRPRPQPKTRA